jgi:SAM-dependent methyltransferase
MDRCNVCDTVLGPPVYRSPGGVSITSLAEVRPGRTEVRYCAVCGHLLTPPLDDLETYYESEYRLLLESAEADQLYTSEAGKDVFRVDHQVSTLLAQLALDRDARVLDFGCGKGATARCLAERRPDLDVHLFDVSDMYVPFWESFAAADRCTVRWATRDLPSAWRGRFDLVTAFFVLEHVVQPVEVLARLAGLLAPGGRLYFLVPDVWTNPADFVVADHVSHFTEPSLRALLERAGLRLLHLDDGAHEGAWIVTAGALDPGDVPEAPRSVPVLAPRVEALAGRWRDASSTIRAFEARRGGAGPAAIYGAGFYGTFIASCLVAPERVACVLDRNPHRQGRLLAGRPIVAPDAMPADVVSVYVGLNPRTARSIIDAIEPWRGRDLEYLFL